MAAPRKPPHLWSFEEAQEFFRCRQQMAASQAQLGGVPIPTPTAACSTPADSPAGSTSEWSPAPSEVELPSAQDTPVLAPSSPPSPTSSDDRSDMGAQETVGISLVQYLAQMQYITPPPWRMFDGTCPCGKHHPRLFGQPSVDLLGGPRFSTALFPVLPVSYPADTLLGGPSLSTVLFPVLPVSYPADTLLDRPFIPIQYPALIPSNRESGTARSRSRSIWAPRSGVEPMGDDVFGGEPQEPGWRPEYYLKGPPSPIGFRGGRERPANSDTPALVSTSFGRRLVRLAARPGEDHRVGRMAATVDERSS
ncbi:MAG: hypothetical protein M1838_001168 [Thelocarpon superellum]|nr:MAG: hypothetical protein M1838_001168 [Thelocarpon superellum]